MKKIPARYILGPWATGLVEAADIQPDENVLDVACGTGLVTRTAAAKLGPQGRITGLDLNEGMLEVARNLATTGAAQPTWIRNSALDMELPDGGFDVVLCQQGLQFFPDQQQALLETHRVLHDRGRACFSIWAGKGAYNIVLADAIAAYINEGAAEQYLKPREVPDIDTLKALFTGAGFRQVNVTHMEMQVRLPEIETFIIAHLLGTPMAEALEQLSAREQAALASYAAEKLSAYADGLDAVVPDAVNLVLAQK